MTGTLLRDYQEAFPEIVVRVGSVDWGVRDSDQDSGRLPVVFLAGAGGTGDVFYRAVGALTSKRRTITLRYPPLAEPDLLISSLSSLIDLLGFTTIDVASSSLGGYLAQGLIIRRPGLVRRVLLGNTFYDASWIQAKLSREAVLATDPAEHVQRTRAQLEGLPDDTDERRDYKRTMLALVGVEQSGEMAVASLAAVLGAKPLGAIDLPLHAIAILDTADDPVVDDTTRTAVRERYTGATLFPLPSGGHYPSLLNPVQYSAAIAVHFSDE